MLNFSSKLIPIRQFNSKIGKEKSSWHFQFESDRGRIINSAAVRRLQQKTQVFPLEVNAAVRSRLTHSLEVQQVGRFLVQSICRKLNSPELFDLERSLESVVEMACLMHDIGNPPFGHFGEQAISDWFQENIVECLNKINSEEPDNPLTLSEEIERDISTFEGNAQGIRLVTTIQKLNLTYPQIASILKYTRCGTEPKPESKKGKGGALLNGLTEITKKVGYYFSEKELVETILSELKIKPLHRHPATYIMEAADDISYCIADLEDAVDKNIISLDELSSALNSEFKVLLKEFKVINSKINLEEEIQKALNTAKKDKQCGESQYFISLRLTVIHKLVAHATQRFIDNLDKVFDGSFDHHLLEDKSEYHCLVKSLKNVSRKRVFNHTEVESNELKGYRILFGILDTYKPLLSISAKKFADLADGNGKLLQLRLYKKIPSKHLRAYWVAVKDKPVTDELEYYFRCRLIQDLVSGMTDHYALQEYKELMALD